MIYKLIGHGAAALTMLAFAAASEPAQARGHMGGGFGHMGGGFGHMGGGFASRPHFSSFEHFSAPRHFFPNRFHHRRFHNRFAFVGVYPGYYANDCFWLKRQAIATGGRYWWTRYYACRDGDY